jgi:hypothetical protein
MFFEQQEIDLNEHWRDDLCGVANVCLAFTFTEDGRMTSVQKVVRVCVFRHLQILEGFGEKLALY